MNKAYCDALFAHAQQAYTASMYWQTLPACVHACLLASFAWDAWGDHDSSVSIMHDGTAHSVLYPISHAAIEPYFIHSFKCTSVHHPVCNAITALAPRPYQHKQQPTCEPDTEALYAGIGTFQSRTPDVPYTLVPGDVASSIIVASMAATAAGQGSQQGPNITHSCTSCSNPLPLRQLTDHICQYYRCSIFTSLTCSHSWHISHPFAQLSHVLTLLHAHPWPCLLMLADHVLAVVVIRSYLPQTYGIETAT